jgi:cytochrome c-type biogenesis protein CcmH/NrfG
VPSSILVFVVAASLTAAAAFWVLRAYRREGARAAPALAICGLVAIFSLGTYLVIGRPELPDAPFRARLEALKHRDPTTYNLEETLAVLDQAAKQNPRDPLPHFYTGQLLLRSNQPELAARAFDAALRRDPQLAEAKLGLGRALVHIDRNHVSAQALVLFQQAGAALDDPAPWIYQAMAAMQDNRAADAQRFWGEAYTRMSADDPRREMARRASRGEAGVLN